MPFSYEKQNCLWTLSNVPWGQNQHPSLPIPLPLPHLLVNHWPSPLTWACLIRTWNPTAVISVHPWEMLQRKWALCSQQSPDCFTIRHMRNGLPWWLRGKEPTWQCKRHGFAQALIPGWGRSSGEGNGNPLQYSSLRNPLDRGAWRATVHMVVKSQTRLSN